MKAADVIDCFVRSMQSTDVPFAPILESRLPARFPSSFRSLVARYAFPAFDCGPLSLFGNSGQDADDDLSVAIFRDPFLSPFLLAHGFLQFARPATGSYDPICFDTNDKNSRREWPIVQINHEEILSRERIGKVMPIAAAFLDFAADSIKDKK